MIRLAWRQFRSEAIIGVAALIVVAVVLAITGPHLMSVYRMAPDQVTSTYHTLQVAVVALLVIVPAIIGIFFGAPLVARELETGTFRLVWTQSVTRLRWLTIKLAVVGFSSALLAGGFSLIAAWWANPINIVNQNRFSSATFGILGIVPFGYALFAVTLGATVGLIFRRTLPAMATTLVGYVATRYAVTYWVRPHFQAPLRMSARLSTASGFSFINTPTGLSMTASPPPIPNAWPLSASIVDKAGHTPTSSYLQHACPALTTGPGAGRVAGGPHTTPVIQGSMQTCIANVSAKFHEVVSYQPANRYWPFQIYETALFVVLALALAGLSMWCVRRRVT